MGGQRALLTMHKRAKTNNAPRRGRVGNRRELLVTRATIVWLGQMSPHVIKRCSPPPPNNTCQLKPETKTASRSVIKHEQSVIILIKNALV